MRREASAAPPFSSCVPCAAVLLLGAGCGEPPASLVLVTFDTLRADHTSAYGYDFETTPTLRRE